eukprot:5347040-Amphidinium_carterae.1
MSSVTTLGLGGNMFTGTLPWELENMEQALSLDVHRNRITGSLPGSLSGLTSIVARSNKLVGALPEFGLKHSIALMKLDIRQNMFSKTLPEEGLRGMTKLMTLLISHN